MNRKHNPKMALVALVLLLDIILLVLCSCSPAEAAAAGTKPAPRFTAEYAGNGCEIITDNETGVQYLAYEIASNYGKGVGLCKLED